MFIAHAWGQNPIVTENQLPGAPASEWDIVGAGDLSIQGFATDMSYNKGATAEFKVTVTGPSTNYNIKIYRLGYYQGNGARMVVDLGNFPGTAQPACITEAPTGLIDCGNWPVSATWSIPANAVSGLYIAKLTRADNNGASHIAFVVRDDESTADLIFKTSDATWQAYNGYGGNSLYTGTVPGFPSGHAPKVSYNRPFITRAGNAGGGPDEDWIFNAEYPMIRFLERNGYDLVYTTDVDLERNPHFFTTGPDPQLKHKVFLSVGHDEYWSGNERAYVEAARDAGMHLAFFSGNEVYWRTRWENSIDGTDTPFRTLVCYKEGTLGENGCGGKCDPSPEWTGLWRDGCDFPGAGGCNPENILTGQMSWELSTGAIQVTADMKDYRFWRNAPNVPNLGPGGVAVMTFGTIGFEWNPYQEEYAASYPSGRVLLSKAFLNGLLHQVSLHRNSNGTIVFGAGTVQWSWGLDENHDLGNAPPSPDMQQATINLFADMGVQPATLMPGMTPAVQSTDVTPPVSVINSPADGAAIPFGNTVVISGTAVEDEGIAAGVEVSTDGGATWQLATGITNWTINWTPSALGTATIMSRAFDDLGNMEIPAGGQPNFVTITVGPPGDPDCPCTLWLDTNIPGTPSSNDANAVELGVKFQSYLDGFITGIRFYKGALNTGTHTGNLWSASGQNLATAVFSNESPSGWQQVSFSVPVAIQANTTYIASYHTTSGFYAFDPFYFTEAYVNNPLTALANGDDGPNGVYNYSPVSSFPTNSFQASNYWVDLVFITNTGPDETPPTVVSVVPPDNTGGGSINTVLQAVFSEQIAGQTLSASTFSVNDGGGAVAGTVSYNPATLTATFTPAAPLAYSTLYTATLTGGPSGITDLAGNPLTADFQWSFTTAAPPPPPSEGPGGPILAISSAVNPFSRYSVEILRAQGLNDFTAMDISMVTPAILDAHDVVILGEFPLSSAQVTELTNWVNAGGTLIALRPDPQLASLLGITPAGGSLSEGYLLVNTATGPGAGIVNETIQYHGAADYYNLSGATALATLYSNATTPTAFPAVTFREVGANGGKAAAFTFDLARSIVFTRQGNPAWEGQNRDAVGTDAVIRPNDLFFGNAPGDPQPDWVNLDKAAIPQADEQMHLLTNIILQGNLHRKPLPRFWFLPNKFKAAVVMTGDDHGVGLTGQFFDQFIASSPSNTPEAVANWQAVRGSSYVYTNTPISDALSYQNQGFEISIHVNTGCDVWTPASLASNYTSQLAQFALSFPGIFPPSTHRTHCIAWSDYDTQPQVESNNGIRLDANYYYWPASWIQDRPGLFTGSGLPMRFAQKTGEIIDCFQVTTQLTDESGQNIPLHINTLLDNAVGASQYFGVFCANMHTDNASSLALAGQIISSAQARNVPVVSARQMLEWLDGRNGSTFGNMAWNGNDLSFDLGVGSGANNLYGMVPAESASGSLVSITLNGSPVAYDLETIKGIAYALFPASPGSYVASYGVDATPPVISNITATPYPDGTALVTWDTDEPATSRVDYALAGNALDQNESASAYVTSHSILLSGLTLGATYDFRVSGVDLAGNNAEAPETPGVLSFTMPDPPVPACAQDATSADFSLGAPDANTVVILQGDGGVALKPAINEEFEDASLPAGWSQGLWDPSGVVSFSGGNVSVNGGNIYTNSSFVPGASIEFEATFRAGPFQNVAFASNADFDAPWAAVGTGINGDATIAFGVLAAGDINVDNNVSGLDLSAIISVYNTTEGNPGYIPAADFDCSGTIGGIDLSALISNYNTQGDEPGNL